MAEYSYADTFKALGDDIRLRIVDMLAERELCGSEILEAFSISQPTLSYHMKLLVGCGVVKSRKHGLRVIYSVDGSSMAAIRDYDARMTELLSKRENEAAETDAVPHEEAADYYESSGMESYLL